jgi:hypothetical protein
MAEETHISITEVTILTGRTKGFRLDVDNAQVTIPIDEALFAHYQNQFWRDNPTTQQKKKFGTLMSLLRAAYRKGVADGKKG